MLFFLLPPPPPVYVLALCNVGFNVSMHSFFSLAPHDEVRRPRRAGPEGGSPLCA